MIEEIVPSALDGERLDRVVSIVTGASRSDAALLVTLGGVELDGVVVSSGKQRLREGQRLVVDPTRLPVDEPPAADSSIDVRVVHVDDDVIVVDKPAGLVVHPGAGNQEGTLVNGLLARFPELSAVGERHRPGIVHRLDVGTSGLMVVARTPTAYDVLVAALSEHRVERVYRALVWGVPTNPVGVIDAPIGRDHRDPLRMAVVVDGKVARTRYRLLSSLRYGDIAEVECRLETGRTHQIRVHLAAIGHPVVGDATYGGNREAFAIDRPMLHAESLAFRHPVHGEPLEFHSPLPADMVDLIDQLGRTEPSDDVR